MSFTTRPLSKPNRICHYLAITTIVISSYFAFCALKHALYTGAPEAEAKESLVFHLLPQKQIILGPAAGASLAENAAGFWQAPKEPQYKNDRLKAYQGMLRARGITKAADIRLLVAQLLQEDGALSENVDGDHGCSIGIPQRNVCLFKDPLTGKRFTAKTFRERYPAWNDWQTQMTWMADATTASYKSFHADVRLTIIHHNSPAAAARGVDTRAGYFRKIAARSTSLSFL